MTQTAKNQRSILSAKSIRLKPPGKKRGPGRPFPPGVSGNLSGRPPGIISLTEVVKRKLLALRPDGQREAIEVLADNIIQDALDSSDRMRELIWNYLDGKPSQKIEGIPPANVQINLTQERNLIAIFKNLPIEKQSEIMRAIEQGEEEK